MSSRPLLEATQHHALWETGALEPPLEELLQKYVRSVGHEAGGTPSELIQGACRLARGRLPVHAKGPADCVDEPLHESGDPEVEEDELQDDQNCAAALDGGVDDITPVQLWDLRMRK
ncbi:hypothetical protein N9L68_00080 [bacterium]|nr:hypothetical protein [bacterium]